MQLYWHTVSPSYPPLQTVPENRVYVSADTLAAFVHDFLAFSHGKVVSDESNADGIEIGRPGETFHRIRIESIFGKMVVLVTDGHLPFPYGHELTGYETPDLKDTLDKAKASGARMVAGPYVSDRRNAAVLEFPGGYIVEVHAAVSQP